MLLREAVVEAKATAAWIEDDDDPYKVGYFDALNWMLGLLAECEDLTIEELTD